jgi:hypothetical protein
MPKGNETLERLKSISMFDPNKDFKDQEKKEHLSVLFNELIMSDEPEAQQFFVRFKSGVDKIIKDMGVVDKTASDTSVPDEVDMTATPPEGEPKAETPPAGGGAEALPDDLLNASYNYLLDRANSFLYM